MIKNKVFLVIVRIALGSFFIWSGILKIKAPLEFAQNVANYRISPADISFLVALVLPWIEFMCGVFLIVGLFQRASSLILTGLLSAFIGLIILTMIRGLDVDCGCFGSLSRKVDYLLVLTDIFLLYLSLSVFLSFKRPFKDS